MVNKFKEMCVIPRFIKIFHLFKTIMYNNCDKKAFKYYDDYQSYKKAFKYYDDYQSYKKAYDDNCGVCYKTYKKSYKYYQDYEAYKKSYKYYQDYKACKSSCQDYKSCDWYPIKQCCSEKERCCLVGKILKKNLVSFGGNTLVK